METIARDAPTGPPEKERVVVCAFDGSAVDANAVEVATRLASALRARLALVAIVAPPLETLDGHLPRPRLDEARRALELTAQMLEHPFGTDCYLDSGNPVQRLIDFAARKRALLLVVGTHGRFSPRPTSIVASGVSRNAPCPVVVVPDGIAVSALSWPNAGDRAS
jgi:nucleotide-binding universal stress UspA family protein